jgi:protoporphyrinogen IX oxidase
MAWLKALHIVGLLMWCAGLIYLPGLLLAHTRVLDAHDFARIRNTTRFAYAAVASPAAFVAIGAGAALLFVADALHGWMFVKLAFVGVMVMVHVQYGFILGRLADRESDPPRLRLTLVFIGVLAAMGVVLWLVLAKPAIPILWLPDWAMEPGGLQSLLSGVIPI